MKISRTDIQNFVAGVSAGFLLTWTFMPCPACAATSCGNVEAPPAQYLPFTGPTTRLVRPLAQVGSVCRAFGALESGTVCGCSTWGFDPREGRLVHVQFIADVPEQKLIEDHEDAHGNRWKHRGVDGGAR